MPFTPREVIAKLKRAGFEEVRQTGSHLFLRNADGNHFSVIPRPKKIRFF